MVFRARQKSLNRTVALKIIALGHWAGAPPALTFAAPDLVIRDERGEIYSVRYDAVNAMLLNEFLKEHRKVQEQESRLAKQESIVAGQQKQIETLTAGLQKVSNRLEVAKTTLQIARSDND